MRIVLIVAMDKEFAQLRRLLDSPTAAKIGRMDAFCGHICGHDVLLCQCGVGKVNAAIGAVEAIRGFSPDLVVSTGVAGGAQTSLRVMDVVMSSECSFHDAYCGKECQKGQIIGMPARFESFVPPRFVAEQENISNDYDLKNSTTKKINNSSTQHPRVVSGLIVTGDWFVDSRDKMRSILDSFPDAMAVDMESAAIAQVCHVYGVEFLSFRIISDVPLSDNEAAQYFDFWDRLADGSFEVTKNLLEKL